MKGITPILVAKPDDKTRAGRVASPRGPYAHIVDAKGRDEVLAWAVERPDGGRGFGFTGAHTHKNWGNPNFRTLVLNAILWTAKLDVPSGGVQCNVSTEELEEEPRPQEMSFRLAKWTRRITWVPGESPRARSSRSAPGNAHDVCRLDRDRCPRAASLRPVAGLQPPARMGPVSSARRHYPTAPTTQPSAFAPWRRPQRHRDGDRVRLIQPPAGRGDQDDARTMVSAKLRGLWRFEEVAPGRTRVSFEYSLRARPAAVMDLEPDPRKVFARDTRRRLETLKKSVEEHGLLHGQGSEPAGMTWPASGLRQLRPATRRDKK